MNDLETFIGPKGLPSQLFNGRLYQLRPSDPRYFERGGRVRLHVVVWTFYNGKPPKKHHIHHKDGNKHNNKPENLELKKASDHLSEHMNEWKIRDPDHFLRLAKSGQDSAAKWSKTEEGLAFRRQHVKNVLFKYHDKLHKREVEKVCEVCGNRYVTTNLSSKNSRFCSNNCKSEFRRRSGIDDEVRKCKMCNRDFTANKYTKKKFCSRSCSSSFIIKYR